MSTVQSIYKFKKLNETDILLEKVPDDFIDETQYNKEILENGNIIYRLCKKIIIDNYNLFNSTIQNYNLCNSTIIKCEINNKIIDKLKYKNILINIYNIIKKGSTIIKNSIINIETINKNTEGFRYYPELGISIQGVDANKCLKEIITQCHHNNISININIILIDKTNITINI